MNARRLSCALGVSLAACLGGCHSEAPTEAPPPTEAPSPDRLTETEQLPEAETAFGLAMPAGMHLVRYFNDAAYFSGEVALESVLDHVRQHIVTRDMEEVGQGVLIARATIVGDESNRIVRIELEKTARGTQVHVQDITPPPALTGASEADIWRQVGRLPDGTPADQNSAY